MADLLGTLFSSLELTGKVINYLNDLRDGGKQRGAIRRKVEAAGKIIATLYHLQNGVHQDAKWLQQLQTITSVAQSGAKSLLCGYEDLLQEIIRKLEPKDQKNSTAKQFSKIAHTVKWPFKKEEVQAMVKDLNSLEISFQSVLHSVQIGMMSNIIDSVSQSADVLESKLDQIQLGFLRSQDEKDFREHCSWLSDVSPCSQVKSLVDMSKASPPTWIFEDQAFEEWRTDSSSRVLWASGNPGAGKSVLAAVVAERLRAGTTSSSTKASVATFFYRYNDNVSLEDMLRCITRQLLEQGGVELLPTIKKARRKAGRELSRDKVTTLLSELWSNFNENFLVIDALDECDASSQSATVLQLKKLLKRTSSLRIMVTSRGDMKMYFSEKEYLCQAKHVQVAAPDANVRVYVSNKIEEIAKRPETALYDMGADVRKAIVERVVQCTAGVFLLAVRHVHALGECENQYSLEKAVSNLSGNLDETIEDAVRRIQAQKESRRELGMRTLLWIVNMRRPLHLSALQHALATYGSGDDLDDRHMEKEINVFAATGGLIMMDPGSGMLFMHRSILDHFNSKHNIEMFGNDPNAEMARTCIKYLCFSRFDTMGWEFDKNPFLEYAALFWICHVATSIKREKLIQEIMGYAHKKRQLQSAVQTVYNVVMYNLLADENTDSDTEKSSNYIRAFNSLHWMRAILVQILESDNYDEASYTTTLLSKREPFTCKLALALVAYIRLLSGEHYVTGLEMMLKYC